MDLTCASVGGGGGNSVGNGRHHSLTSDEDEQRESTRMHSVIQQVNPDSSKPLTPAQELRKATKPLMEKRRRARINQCLQELKDLILEALNKDPARHNKLEKADILEMAVTHLKNVHRQARQTPAPPPESVGKYRAGFTECANEVSRFVNNVNVLQPEVKQKLIGHLSSCINTLDSGPLSPPLGYPIAHSPPSQLEPGNREQGSPPLSYSPFPSMSPSSHRSSPPLVPSQMVVAFPGMMPPLNQDLNNNIHTVSPVPQHQVAPQEYMEEDDAPLDFSKKYSPKHPGTTGGFPNPRKKYLASVSRGSCSSSSEDLPPPPPELEVHAVQPIEPVNYSKNVFRGASAPHPFGFGVDCNRMFFCDEDDDMWRPW